MKVEKKKVIHFGDKELIIKYFRYKLIGIDRTIISFDFECNKLYCNNIIILKYILKIYNDILNIKRIYNKNINVNDIINDRLSSKLYNIYLHVINKHEYLRSINIFNHLCNNNNCQYNIRNRNNNNNNILDTIHHNIIHYKYNINNNHRNNNKYNKFITQINNIKKYDNGQWIDFYGYLSERDGNFKKCKYKYGNIKQEMLYPKRLTYGIWNKYQNKVNILSKIPNIKQFKAKTDILSTDSANIYSGEIITKEHILAIILYTDNDILCYNLRKAFREYDEHGIRKQDINDISEYANWAKLLFESIFVYGNNINYNTEYYHGLNNKFIFSKFVIRINMPI